MFQQAVSYFLSIYLTSYLLISEGTGKSVTGAHLAFIFAKLNGRLKHEGKGKCVVYCGPSNKAVDVVHGQFYHLLCPRFM